MAGGRITAAVTVGVVAGASCLALGSWRSRPPLPIDARAYTLGVVSDYMGRAYVPAHPESRHLVESFHDTEQPLLHQVVRLLQAEAYPYHVERSREENCVNCHEFQLLISPKMARQINSRYSWSWSKGWDDHDHRTYHGQLYNSRLRNSISRMSFLAGAYARYGQREGDTYAIVLGNSVGKYRLILKHLVGLGCDTLATSVTETVPFVYQVRFLPTKALLPYLEAQNAVVDSLAARRRR